MPKRLVAGFVVAGLLPGACAGRRPEPRHPGPIAFRPGALRSDVGRYPYDPGKARQLLRQAGAEGVTVTLGSPGGRYMGDSEITEAVAGDLRAAGLQVNVPEPLDWPIWDDAPWILLHHQKLPVVTTTRVVGVTMLPNEQFDTVYARPG